MKGCINSYMKVGIVQFMAFPDSGLDSIREIASSFTLDKVIETTGLSENDIGATVDLLDSDESTMLVYGSKVASFARTFVRLQEVLEARLDGPADRALVDGQAQGADRRLVH